MLKLVAPRPSARPRESRETVKAREEVRMLHQRIQEERDAAASNQRAVARGRRTVVEVGCGLQRASRRPRSEPHSAAPADLAGLAARVREIHRRLLEASTSVELETDRLNLVQAELDQITGRSPAVDGSRRP
jgi:hypothetical protein